MNPKAADPLMDALTSELSSERALSAPRFAELSRAFAVPVSPQMMTARCDRIEALLDQLLERRTRDANVVVGQLSALVASFRFRVEDLGAAAQAKGRRSAARLGRPSVMRAPAAGAANGFADLLRLRSGQS